MTYKYVVVIFRRTRRALEKSCKELKGKVEPVGLKVHVDKTKAIDTRSRRRSELNWNIKYDNTDALQEFSYFGK